MGVEGDACKGSGPWGLVKMLEKKREPWLAGP